MTEGTRLSRTTAISLSQTKKLFMILSPTQKWDVPRARCRKAQQIAGVFQFGDRDRGDQILKLEGGEFFNFQGSLTLTPFSFYRYSWNPLNLGGKSLSFRRATFGASSPLSSVKYALTSFWQGLAYVKGWGQGRGKYCLEPVGSSLPWSTNLAAHCEIPPYRPIPISR